MLQVYLAPTDHDAVTPQAEGQLPPALWLLHIENCEDNTWWFQCFKSTMIRFAESAECKGWKYRQNSVCLTVSLSPILFRPFFQHFFHPLEDLVKAVQTAQHMSEISMWEVSGIWQQGKTQGLVGFWEIKRWDSIWMYLVASRIYIYIYTTSKLNCFSWLGVWSQELDLAKLPRKASLSGLFRGVAFHTSKVWVEV